MRKFVTWILVISICIFVIDWGVLGLKIYDGNYGFQTEAYIALVCFIVMFFSIIYLKFTNRCPNCKKTLLTKGKYCYHCGKEI